MQPRQSTIDLLSDLIAFDTVSRHSNLQLIEYIGSVLDAIDVPYMLSHDESGKKANLFATIGQSKAPGIVLSGHTDVVPVDGQNWSTDPFVAKVKGDKLFGRGTCDMKGFIAICLSHAKEIVEADLSIPIHFAFSYDEEVGCVGVQGLLAQLAEKNINPRACIIGEPTNMGVIRAHKGMLSKHCRIHGHASHSSLIHRGANAITAAAKIIAKIDSVQKDIQQKGPFDEGFEPPYSTLHCGVIHGGTVNNIIPALCEFEFEIRNLPDHNPLPVFAEIESYANDEILPALKTVSESCAIEWQAVPDYPGMDTDLSDPLVNEVAQLTDSTLPIGKVSYGTEGGRFQKHGITSVICGPGSIEQAHKPDEYITLEQLAKGENFISALIESL